MSARSEAIETAQSRAQYRCQTDGCGAMDEERVVYRDDGTTQILGEPVEVLNSWHVRYVTAKLTVIHLDHNLTNFAVDNLRCACQHHRRAFHADDFARRRAILRRRKMLKAGLRELFPQEETPDGRLRFRDDVPVLHCPYVATPSSGG